jgi:hypothetical protein
MRTGADVARGTTIVRKTSSRTTAAMRLPVIMRKTSNGSIAQVYSKRLVFGHIATTLEVRTIDEQTEKLKQPELKVSADDEPDSVCADGSVTDPRSIAEESPTNTRNPSTEPTSAVPKRVRSRFLLVAILPMLAFLAIGLFVIRYDASVPFDQQYSRESMELTTRSIAAKYLIADRLPDNWIYGHAYNGEIAMMPSRNNFHTVIIFQWNRNRAKLLPRQLLDKTLSHWPKPESAAKIERIAGARSIAGQQFTMARVSCIVPEVGPRAWLIGYTNLPDGNAAMVLMGNGGTQVDSQTLDRILPSIKGFRLPLNMENEKDYGGNPFW